MALLVLYSYSTAGLVIGLLLSKQSVTVSLRNGCAKSQQNQSKNDLVFSLLIHQPHFLSHSLLWAWKSLEKTLEEAYNKKISFPLFPAFLGGVSTSLLACERINVMLAQCVQKSGSSEDETLWHPGPAPTFHFHTHYTTTRELLGGNGMSAFLQNWWQASHFLIFSLFIRKGGLDSNHTLCQKSVFWLKNYP